MDTYTFSQTGGLVLAYSSSPINVSQKNYTIPKLSLRLTMRLTGGESLSPLSSSVDKNPMQNYIIL